jgi:lysine 6-dehydrogenase
MSYSYAVVGAGRQGVAAGYDLAKLGEASRVLLVDTSYDAALAAASTVNRLTGRQVAEAAACDAGDVARLTGVLRGAQAIVSAAHYNVNLGLTEVAIGLGAHMCDLGGHTGVVQEQHAFDAAARRAGVAIVPDTGMGPGLNVSLAEYAMSLLDEPREVRIWDGGLPQDPEPPWNYRSTFAMSGLTNEYAGHAFFIRHGDVTEVPCFADLETVDFAQPVGRLEAFVTSGGLSTSPWTWRGTLDRLENKTLRYPGHCARLKAYEELGLLGLDPVIVGSGPVVPREVFHALLEPRIGPSNATIRDICVMRVKATGKRAGSPAEAIVELVDRFDETTGFMAMQRLTGWHASIVAHLAVRGLIPSGVRAVESIAGALIVAEGRRRGWMITERRSWEQGGAQ